MFHALCRTFVEACYFSDCTEYDMTLNDIALLNLQKRLESLTEAELQALLEEVEEEKRR